MKEKDEGREVVGGKEGSWDVSHLEEWKEGGWVSGVEGVSLRKAVGLVGDMGFLGWSDEEVLMAALRDRELFGYVWGRVEGEKLAGGLVRRGSWFWRRGLEKVKLMRVHWGSMTWRVCGLGVVGKDDGEWVRRINREYFERYGRAVMEKGMEVSGVDGLWMGRMEGVEWAVGVGQEVSMEVEREWRERYFGRGLVRYLRELGYGKEELVLDAERKRLRRGLGYFWGWVGLAGGGGRRGEVQGELPGLVVDMGVLWGGRREVAAKGGVRVEEVLGLERLGRFSRVLGNGRVVGKLVGAVGAALRAVGEELRGGGGGAGKYEGLLGAMGFCVVGGRLEGRLGKRWEVSLHEVLVAEGVFAGEAYEYGKMAGVIREVVGKMMEESGLVEGMGFNWVDGVEGGVGGVEWRMTGRVRSLGYERLMGKGYGAGGMKVDNWVPGRLGGLTMVRRSGTVMRGVIWERLSEGEREYWSLVEKMGSRLAEGSMADARMVSIYDGLAGAYLEYLFKGLGGVGLAEEGLWDGEVDEGMIWVLRDALLASQSWAFEVLLREGDRWLGLSRGYRRRLERARERLEEFLVGCGRGVYVYEGREVEGGEDVFGGPIGRGGLLAGDQPFCGEWDGEKERFRGGELMGMALPRHVKMGGHLVPLLLLAPLRSDEYLTKGCFVEGEGGEWRYRKGVKEGAVLPGLSGVGAENDARAMVQVVSLAMGGLARHRRAVLLRYGVLKGGGRLPAGWLGLLPVDVPSPVGYAETLECGVVLGDTFDFGGEESLPLLYDLEEPVDFGVRRKYVEGVDKEQLQAQWGHLMGRPSLGYLGWMGYCGLALLSRARRAAAKKVHPVTGVPIVEGGGAPERVRGLVKKVWAPLLGWRFRG